MDSEWEKAYSYTESVAKLHHITPESTIVRSRRPLRRFDKGILYETTGARETGQVSESYKVNLYYPVIDALLFELKQRFTDIKTSWELFSLVILHPVLFLTQSIWNPWSILTAWIWILSSWNPLLPNVPWQRKTFKRLVMLQLNLHP